MSHQSFTIKDAEGASHRYDVDQHRGSEGQRLFMFLSSLIIEPLAEAAGPVLVNVLTGSTAGGQVDTARLMSSLLDDSEAMEALVANLPAAARAARRSLLTLSDETIWAVLRYTNRDGEPLISAKSGKPTGAFDEAFAGNYMELGRAVFKVAQVNGFFPGLGTSGSGPSEG